MEVAMIERHFARHAVVLFLFGLLVSANAWGGTAAPLDCPFLQPALERSIADHRVPGAVAAVQSPDGAVWMGAAGWADLEKRVPIEKDMFLHIGSLTKSMTATAFLTLVDDGLVGLDDTVEHWLPGLVHRGADMTVRNLLNMRSGLAHYEANTEFQERFVKEPRHVFNPADLLAYCNRHIAEPDTVFDYNNINYFLVGMIAEKAAGEAFATIITGRVIEPLGLSHTSFPMTADMPQPAAHGYLSQDGRAVDHTTAWDPSAMWASGSVISQLDDMLAWIRHLVAGTLVSPEMHAAQFDFLPADDNPDNGYGFGVGRKQGLVGHSGNYNGLYTAAIYQVDGFNIVVLSNGQADGGGEDSMASNILEDLVTELKTHGVTKSGK